MGAPAVLDVTSPDLEPGTAARDEAPTAGAVALVADDSVASLAAARWAARLAAEQRSSLVVVVLDPGGPDGDAADAVLARVQPALDGSGRPYVVRSCPAPARARGRRFARRVRQLVPDDASVLVLPGSVEARHGLASALARRRDLDMLVVPDLRAVDPGLLASRPTGEGSGAPDERSGSSR